MIRIIIQFKNNLCSSIEVSGHANYADYGHDIVCSGVTTATFTSINLIDKVDSNCYKLEQKEEAGYLHLTLDYEMVKKENIDFIQLIVQNYLEIVEDMKNNYPKNLKIEII